MSRYHNPPRIGQAVARLNRSRAHPCCPAAPGIGAPGAMPGAVRIIAPVGASG